MALFQPSYAQWEEGWNGDFFFSQGFEQAETENVQKTEVGTDIRDKVTTSIEAGIALTNGTHLPFYLASNSFGMLSPEHSQGYLRGTVRYKASKWRWAAEYCADLIAYASSRSDYYGHNLHLQQLYAKFNYDIFHVTLGSRERNGEFVDPTLSTGNMVWSGNARPAPGVHIGMDEFLPLIIIDNFLEAKVDASWDNLTDGSYNKASYDTYASNYPLPEGQVSIFGDNISDLRQHSLVCHAWIHHKSLFLRTRSSWPFYFTAGFEHACMYGGRVNGHNNVQGSGWMRSAVGNKGDSNIGYNHLMSFDFRGDLSFNSFKLGIYKQHYTDDMEGGLFDSGMDGLWGIELKLPKVDWLNHIVAELLYTTNQNGVVYANDIYNYDNQFYAQAGNSNFYHDEAYGAWAHYGIGLGNPLLMSPVYNDDNYPDYQSNMIRAIHLGVSGCIADKVSYTLKAHHQESWGSPFAPFVETRKNTSLHAEADYRYNDWQFIPAVSFDNGDLFGNNIGFRLKVRYSL